MFSFNINPSHLHDRQSIRHTISFIEQRFICLQFREMCIAPRLLDLVVKAG
jgi:hypothetical protein